MTTTKVTQLVRDYLAKNTNLNERGIHIAAAYVMATWLYQRYDQVKYLKISAPVGAGKTNTLKVLSSLCYNAFLANATHTEGFLLQVMNLNPDRGVTLCIDDVSSFKIYDANGPTLFSAILSAGARRDTGFIVADGDALSVYGPKIIVHDRQFNDLVIDSRFLTVELNYGHHRFTDWNANTSVAGAIAEWAESIKGKKQIIPTFETLIFALAGDVNGVDPTAAIEG